MKDDCFAVAGDMEGCTILIAANCTACKFYKTREQLLEERRQSVARLQSLGIWPYIWFVYYAGKTQRAFREAIFA